MKTPNLRLAYAMAVASLPLVACDLIKKDKSEGAGVDAAVETATAETAATATAAPEPAEPAADPTPIPTLVSGNTSSGGGAGGGGAPAVPVDAGTTAADAGAVVDAGQPSDAGVAPIPTPTLKLPSIPGFDAGSLIPQGFDAGGFKPPWQK